MWNTDGSVFGEFGRVGMGGLLRNFGGDCMCIFFFYIGIKEFNEVEFIAYVMVFEIIVGEILLKG